MAFSGEATDPCLKSRLRLAWQAVTLDLAAPHSVFSNTWIDNGTRLLLDNLPAGEPRTFLDLGCGYGALGLPIAARFPRSRGLLVDRDLLAVEYCGRNAAANGVGNVEVTGSLGYRDVPERWNELDWILLNFPARAGGRALQHFIESGRRRLAPSGEMRVVVISPLAPVVEGVSESAGLGGRRIAQTPHHAVFAFGPRIGEAPAAGERLVERGDEVYLRDTIELALPGSPRPLRLDRPTDLADEPHRLRDAIPLLAESLPAGTAGVPHALVVRCGYGLVPALLLTRSPNTAVVAADRDLLGTAFTRRNCEWAGGRIRVVETTRLADPGSPPRFDLIAGELLPPLGAAATLAELAAVREALAPGGQAMIAGLVSQWKELSRLGGQRFGFKKLSTKGSCAVYAHRARV